MAALLLFSFVSAATAVGAWAAALTCSSESSRRGLSGDAVTSASFCISSFAVETKPSREGKRISSCVRPHDSVTLDKIGFRNVEGVDDLEGVHLKVLDVCVLNAECFHV